MAQEPFLINPPKRLRRRNPVGETLVTIGMNPSRRNPMQTNPWFGDSEGHRIAALMRWGKVRKGHVSRHRGRKRRVVHRGRKRTYRAKRRVIHRARVRRMAYRGSVRDRRTKAYRAYRSRQMREAKEFLGLTAGPRKRYKYRRGKGWIKFRNNPFGRYSMARRRKDNAWFGQRRRHRKAAKKGWRRGHHIGSRIIRHRNAWKGHRAGHRRAALKGWRRRKHYRDNPGTYSNPRRRRYRNPGMRDMMGAFTGKGGLTDAGYWAPLALTGSVSAMTTQLVPGFFGLQNPFAQIGTKLVVAFGGGAAVGKFVGREHGNVWMLVGVSLVAYQLLKQFVLMPFAPQFAVSLGASEYQDYYGPSEEMVSQEVGAFPQAISAYPQEMSAYPGVGAEQENVGAYPYDGHYGY